MADYQSFRLGHLSSPVTASPTNSLLRDADPALYWFIEWCKGVIETHVGGRWDVEVATVGLSDLAGKIVRATIPYDPVPLFQEAQYQFPLLAIYRVDSDFNDTSTTWIRRIGTWNLDYILPPLSPAQLERLYPVLSVIEAAIYDRVNHDRDPSVLSGQTLASLMGTESIKLMQSKPSRDWLQTTSSQAGGTNSVLFPLLHMRFDVAERAMPVPYEAWTGVDANVSVANAGYPPVDIADLSLDNP